ncbi:MAG: ATP-dependent helicase PcrA, partial [Bacilli bacterium]|nr:ATP-dependent helicase PcrA [Bacilli bacterium]
LKAANAVVRHNVNRKEKNLWSAKGDGEPISVYQGLDPEDEAGYVVRQIQEHIQNGGAYQDCAVLYRANAQSRIVEETLIASAIPYRMVGGLTFYDRREIKDTFAYLRALINPKDEISLLRIINNPKRSIGSSTLTKLLNAAHNNEFTLIQMMEHPEDAGLTGAAARAVQDFYSLMMKLHLAQYEGYTVTEYVSEVLHRTGYREQYAISKSEDHESRLQNLDELLRVTRSFDRRKHGSVADFLAEVSILSSLDREQDKEENAVTLMTLHASKGLEFPVVFLLGVEEGILPHERSVQDEQGVEEERNLMYVGMTRAMQQLYVSYCTERSTQGQAELNEPSRFLAEIPEQFIVRGEFTYEVDENWQAGDLLVHRTWGQGVIVEISGSGADTVLHVMFHPKIGEKDVPIRFVKRPSVQ